jgi:hypothetical protein
MITQDDQFGATFPPGATLRVVDRTGGRRILYDEIEVTHVAARILHFNFPETLHEQAWIGAPEDIIRLIALGLYGDEEALHCELPRSR